MPLTGTGPILGVAMAAGAGSVDAPGIAAWIGVGDAIATWMPANLTVLPGAMVAAGVAVGGFGLYSAAAAPTLGVAMAAGAGSVDAPGITAWIGVATALVAHVVAFGQANPNAFVANPLGGPVVGAGQMQFTNPAAGPALAAGAGSVDAPGIAAWTGVGTAILTHMAANTIVLSLGFTSPPGGGPLVGTAHIL